MLDFHFGPEEKGLVTVLASFIVWLVLDTAGKLSSFFLWFFYQYMSIRNSVRYQGFVFFNTQEFGNLYLIS